MCLVIDDRDVLEAHQAVGDTAHHLPLGLLGPKRLPTPLQCTTGDLVHGKHVAQLEGVIVRDDDLGLSHVIQHVGRDKFSGLVIALGVLRHQHAQAVADGDTRRDDQEPAGELS